MIADRRFKTGFAVTFALFWLVLILVPLIAAALR